MTSPLGNTIFMALLFACVVAAISGFVAKKLVHPDELQENAFKIDVPDVLPSGAIVEEEEVLEPVIPLLASADVERGSKLARACMTCHVFEQGGANRTGPVMWDIVGRPYASVEGFAYSTAFEEHGGRWTYQELNGFLKKPKEWVPGTKMNYVGIKDVEDRANIIAWMRTLSPDPKPLPSEEEVAAVLAAQVEDAAEDAGLEPDAMGEDVVEEVGEAIEQDGDTTGEAVRDAVRDAVEDAVEDAREDNADTTGAMPEAAPAGETPASPPTPAVSN